MTFSSRYSQLNQAQKKAVDTTEGPVMVVAGPGTGKTELLSVRVANILQKTDTLPENILLLTFTESGQTAMRERLVGIIGKDAYKVAIHTFHSFGSDIIAQNREYFYRNAQFSPADEIKQYEVLRGVFEELDYDNPLATTMNGEFTHLRDAQRSISELKRGSALSSDELLAVIQQSEADLDFSERLLRPVLSERVGKQTGAQLAQVHSALLEQSTATQSLYGVTPLIQVISESLETMLEMVATEHPTKPISAWKAQWFERNEHKELVFKDRKRLVKLKALSFIYYEYLLRMERLGLFDYDDMIMQVVRAVEQHDDLRFNLQEKYLYIMVDEFQDTNLAQLRILSNLTDNPVNEGNPNVLVVGDDDQAVYGFQGADVSNILSFSEQYPSRSLIVLTENYRSGAPILTSSREVITQGTDRLETRMPEIDKALHAQDGKQGSVEIWENATIESERQTIAESIATALQKGADPSSIAILGRRHSDIQAMLPYLQKQGIPVRYERQESVLESEPIKALVAVSRVILAIAKGEHSVVNALLPELLAHPVWQVAPEELWRLSLDAYNDRRPWMEIMQTTPRFVLIHSWLIEKALLAETQSLEHMIDSIVGNSTSEGYQPYFQYYFSNEKLESSPSTYLQYLNALRSIRAKLREHKPEQILQLRDFVAFVDLHERLAIGITQFGYSVAKDVSAVQLLTAHKSKGLEFDTVFVLHSIDSIWGHSARTMSRSITYPQNLPLAPAGSTSDERLRLFYVAMTRAKQQLVLSYSLQNDAGKKTLIADFLLDNSGDSFAKSTNTVDTVQAAELAWYQPLVEPTQTLKELLAPTLESFKLSATTLNAFLDVTNGGPRAFLLNNLLHFPSAKSPSAAYGTAIHWTMQQAHTHLNATGEEKPLEDILHDFEEALKKERLEPADFEHFLQKGSEDLPIFINSGMLPMNTQQKAEVGFRHQAVQVGEAKLTGSLDLIETNEEEKTMLVTDYKTGKPAAAWEKGTEYTKLKLHKYKQQLLFYKLLVENSPHFGTYTVREGQLAFIEPTKAKESIVLPLHLSVEDVERTKLLLEATWKHIMELSLPDTSGYEDSLSGVLAFEQGLIDGTV